MSKFLFSRFQFYVTLKNGGFVVVHNPENKAETQHALTGVVSQQEMTLAIDRDRPQHCSMTGKACTSPQPLQLNAGFTKDVRFKEGELPQNNCSLFYRVESTLIHKGQHSLTDIPI